MNKLIAIFVASLVLAAVCLLPGCSKSADAKSREGTSSGSDSKTASALPAGPVTLKVNWAVGKEYAMQTEESETVEFKVPEEPKPVKQVRNTTMDYTLSVLKELADGGRELELQFTACKINSTEGNRPGMNFDSARDATPDASDQVGSMFYRLLGEHIRLVTDANGKVTDVQGFKEFADRATANSQPQAKAMFYQMFNEDNFKKLGAMSDGLPDNPVQTGDHWPVNMEFPKPIGIIVIHTKNTFKKWESHAGRQCVRIVFKGDISSKPGPTSANASAKLENGDISGQTWFDPALGMVVQSDDKEDIPLQFKNRGRLLTGQVHRKATYTLLAVTDIGK